MKFLSLLSALLSALLPGFTGAFASSATWNPNPINCDWNTAANWTPNTVPNGPSDTATFDVSNITDVSLSDATEVRAIVFNAGASPFTITCSKEFTISGTGITNSSGVIQSFISNTQFRPIKFIHSATVGSGTLFTNHGGEIEFDNSASAASATFITGFNGDGLTLFRDHATCDSAVFINQDGGTTIAVNGANATFINNLGGLTYFGSGAHAGNATLIANDGGGSAGGVIYFDDGSHGDTARVGVFGNGYLDLSNSFGIGLGSIEGDGIIELGDWVLTVGTNGLSTVFNGLIQDEVSEEFGGTLHKVGSGSLTLGSPNTYRKGTVILGGALLVTNATGSATGGDPVTVTSATLGGSGIIAGPVVIGTGTGIGASLAPGKGAHEPVTSTLQQGLVFKPDSTYVYKLSTRRAEADEVIALEVSIESGAQFNLRSLGRAKLPIGQVFTAISDTSRHPIRGTFANLPDGATVVMGNNTFQADYQGGDGNDLTLTVVP